MYAYCVCCALTFEAGAKSTYYYWPQNFPVVWYILTYMHTYMHRCIDAYMYTCIHKYINTYIHTYIYTYVHTIDLENFVVKNVKFQRDLIL